MAQPDNSRRLRRWLAPDLALTFAVLTMFYCLLMQGGPERLFRDSDTGWHIRTGQSILAGHGLPRSDPFSFSRPNQPWTAWEWASDSLMALAHAPRGLAGVAWLFALTLAAAAWLWTRLAWTAGGDFLLACALFPLFWIVSGLHWLARPHLFSWLWMLLLLLALERPSWRFKPLHAALAFLLAALWANTHPSFSLGFIVLALALLAEPLRWLLWDNADWTRARWILSASACAALGSLANPYGLSLHRHVLAYLADAALLSRVAEFQSFNFHAPGAWAPALCLALTALGAACAFAQRNISRALVLLFFTLMALRSARGLPLAAVAALPLANAAITLALLRTTNLRPFLQRALNAALAYSGALRRHDAGHHGCASALASAALAWAVITSPALAARATFPPSEFPVAAAARLESLPLDARILAPDKFGGYLIYRFNGRRKVFFDGRSDFYGAAFMQQYLRLVEVRPGWRKTVDSYAFSHALLPPDGSLAAALRLAGWRASFEDSVAVLLERPNIAH